MFDQLRVRRGSALVLLVVLNACGAIAQQPAAPSPAATAPVPTAVVSLPGITADPQPSLVPPTARRPLT